jgi:hypothetical protein
MSDKLNDTDEASDLFALGGRQGGDALLADEQALLQAYRALTPEQAIAAVQILEWAAGLDESEDCDPVTERAEPAKPELSHFDRDRLRLACEALAAEYKAPLPEGDAGLIAAIERWRDLEPRHNFMATGIEYTLDDERAVIDPISNAAQTEFGDRIDKWPVQGLAGAAAKLRYLLDNGHTIDVDNIDFEQLIDIIEREAGSRP